MNITDLNKAIRRNTKAHSSLILSVAAGIGTLTTAYLAGRASFQAAEVIRKHEEQFPPADNRKERVIDRTKLVWKLYIPPAISAGTTIGCIVFANRVDTKKILAAQTAVAVTQRAYSEYRDKVIEEFGARKDEAIRDQLASERVMKNPPPAQDILITGPGNVLCCEVYTGRYFASDMETLKRAQNDLNAKLLAHDYATLNDFYYMIGLGQTSYSSQGGWKSNRLMELQFSTILTDDGRPCLSFEYNYVTAM